MNKEQITPYALDLGFGDIRFAPADGVISDISGAAVSTRDDLSTATAHHVEDCLRLHINGPIPERPRGDVYQLFSCEKCQSACPLNSPDRSEPHAVALKDLLEGKGVAPLRALAGANLVRALLSQTALYAANTKAYGLAPEP